MAAYSGKLSSRPYSCVQPQIHFTKSVLRVVGSCCPPFVRKTQSTSSRGGFSKFQPKEIEKYISKIYKVSGSKGSFTHVSRIHTESHQPICREKKPVQNTKSRGKKRKHSPTPILTPFVTQYRKGEGDHAQIKRAVRKHRKRIQTSFRITTARIRPRIACIHAIVIYVDIRWSSYR